MDAREERRGRAGVITGAVAERAPVDLREPAEHVEVLAERLERLHRRTELEIRARALRRPHERPGTLVARADDAVGCVDVAQSNRRGRSERGRRRPHRIEQRQRHGRAEASQKRSPWQGRVEVVHESDALRIRKGVLFTIARIHDEIR